MGPLVGKTLRVTFYDHSEGTDTLLFNAEGFCAIETKDKIVLHTWYYKDDPYFVDDNVEHFALVKDAIKKIKVL